VNENVKKLAKIIDIKSRLEYDNIEELLEELKQGQIALDSEYHPQKVLNWELFFKSKIFGFVQSRLYNGNWNLEDLHQDFDFKYDKKS